MKVKGLLLDMYTAYVLTDKSRNELAEKYPPKYSNFVGHHVTIAFGVPVDSEVPEEADVSVLGIKDTGDGLEALVVSVNGSTERPDGSTYHITWSLEPDKYSPKDSNTLMNNGKKYTLSLPTPLETVPHLLK